MNFRIFTWKLCFFQRFLLKTFKAFCSFDAPFGSILKKHRSTLHYSLVATSAVFAQLKQFKAICPSNRHTDTHTLTDYSNPCYVPTHSKVKNKDLCRCLKQICFDFLTVMITFLMYRLRELKVSKIQQVWERNLYFCLKSTSASILCSCKVYPAYT